MSRDAVGEKRERESSSVFGQTERARRALSAHSTLGPAGVDFADRGRVESDTFFVFLSHLQSQLLLLLLCIRILLVSFFKSLRAFRGGTRESIELSTNDSKAGGVVSLTDPPPPTYQARSRSDAVQQQQQQCTAACLAAVAHQQPTAAAATSLNLSVLHVLVLDAGRPRHPSAGAQDQRQLAPSARVSQCKRRRQQRQTSTRPNDAVEVRSPFHCSRLRSSELTSVTLRFLLVLLRLGFSLAPSLQRSVHHLQRESRSPASSGPGLVFVFAAFAIARFHPWPPTSRARQLLPASSSSVARVELLQPKPSAHPVDLPRLQPRASPRARHARQALLVPPRPPSLA